MGKSSYTDAYMTCAKGFSIGKPNATNEEDISADFVKFFKNFEVGLGRLALDTSADAG